MTQPTNAEDGDEDNRPIWPAFKRGLRGLCPACGRGKIFTAYLKTAEACANCGEALHHHRADDMPPYVTMVIVGHVTVAALMMAQDFFPLWPDSYHMILWPLVALTLSLLLLPIVKGGLVNYQWALRMHGFGDEASDDRDRLRDQP